MNWKNELITDGGMGALGSALGDVAELYRMLTGRELEYEIKTA